MDLRFRRTWGRECLRLSGTIIRHCRGSRGDRRGRGSVVLIRSVRYCFHVQLHWETTCECVWRLVLGHILTVALRYTLSRFEVVGDSTELSSVQLSWAQFNYASSVHRAQLSWTELSSVELSWAQLNWAELSWITHNLEPTKCVPQGHGIYCMYMYTVYTSNSKKNTLET